MESNVFKNKTNKNYSEFKIDLNEDYCRSIVDSWEGSKEYLWGYVYHVENLTNKIEESEEVLETKDFLNIYNQAKLYTRELSNLLKYGNVETLPQDLVNDMQNVLMASREWKAAMRRSRKNYETVKAIELN